MSPQFPGKNSPGNFGGIQLFNLVYPPKRYNPIPGHPTKTTQKYTILIKAGGTFELALHHRQHIFGGYLVIPVEGAHHFYFFFMT